MGQVGLPEAVIPELRRLMQEVPQFKSSLGNLVRPYLKIRSKMRARMSLNDRPPAWNPPVRSWGHGRASMC